MATEWDDGSVQLSTRLPAGLIRRVKIAAFKRETKLADWVSEALAEHLERSKAGSQGGTDE